MRSLAHRLILRGLRAPRVKHEGQPSDQGLAAISLRLPAAEGKTLFAWFVPGAHTGKGPAVVVMHGWGANASMMLAALRPLHTAGFSVLMIDARCHGLSDDASFTSMPRFAQDIEAGIDWLQRHPEVDPQRIALMGHSVGAGAALLSARHRPDIRAVISVSAFANPREVMRTFLAEARIPYPVLGWYVMRHVQNVIGAHFEEIAPLTSITKVQAPVLLVHGRQDTVVPYTDALRLKAAAAHPQTTTLLVDSGHDLRDHLNAHAQTLIRFLQSAMPLPEQARLHGRSPHYPMDSGEDIINRETLPGATPELPGVLADSLK